MAERDPSKVDVAGSTPVSRSISSPLRDPRTRIALPGFLIAVADGTVLDAVAAFDPARGTWTDGPVLPVPVHDVTSTVEALPIGD